MLERPATSVSAPLYAKAIAEKATGIPASRQLISATHTHFAPAAMSCLSSSVDERYAKRLTPARIGSASIANREHNHVLSFICRAVKELTDPFGNKTVRAIQSEKGQPTARLVNYAMHYSLTPPKTL
jgi:hypothetical protein